MLLARHAARTLRSEWAESLALAANTSTGMYITDERIIAEGDPDLS
ncbi:hypothetical protein [Microbacterium telephonicum]|nr:hypothetical protein [Microbacterium telephonicum]